MRLVFNDPPRYAERAIEKYLHKRVAAVGGWHRRVSWIGRKSAPDDFIALPGQTAFFVECKRTGVDATAEQRREHKRLREAGIDVYVVNSPERVDQLFEAYGFSKSEAR